jgi:lia operon protein LiaG
MGSNVIAQRRPVQTVGAVTLSNQRCQFCMPDPFNSTSMTQLSVLRSGIAIAATALAAHSAAAQTERRTVSGSSVAIYDLVGRVTVEQGSGSDVVVEVTRGGRDAKKLSIVVGDVRGRNSLRVRYPDDDIVYPELGRGSGSEFRINSDGTWGGSDDRDDRGWGSGHRIRIKGDGSGTEAWADLKILVPSGKDIAVYLGVGELGATHVTADLRLNSMSGRVTVRDTKGNLIASTGSGGVDVRNASGDDVRIASGSGGITSNDVSGTHRLRISTGSGGVTGSGATSEDLEISSGSGTIRMDDARAPRARLSSGSGGIRVGFASPVKNLDANTGSGGVTVTLPGGLNAELDIRTGSGGIDSDFPVQVNRMERNRLRGQIGDGSGSIRISSGSGTVHLRKL